MSGLRIGRVVNPNAGRGRGSVAGATCWRPHATGDARCTTSRSRGSTGARTCGTPPARCCGSTRVLIEHSAVGPVPPAAFADGERIVPLPLRVELRPGAVRLLA